MQKEDTYTLDLSSDGPLGKDSVPSLRNSNVSLAARGEFRLSDDVLKKISDYLQLVKPRITSFVLLTTLSGFYLGSTGALDIFLLLHALAGAALVAGGAAALNQFLEREFDSQMQRTKDRPLPSGRLQPEEALRFGVALSVTGVIYLAILVNLTTSLLSVVTISSYLFLYTPLKRKTSLNTLIGAIPGSIPSIGGWAAARGEINSEAWMLFMILFFWQFPHFLSIAWIYRDDYAKAGCRMLPFFDPDGKSTGRQAALYCLVLMSFSLIPAFLGMAGVLYFFVALCLSLLLLGFSLCFALFRTEAYARMLMLASLIYLPLLFTVMIFDKVPLS